MHAAQEEPEKADARSNLLYWGAFGTAVWLLGVLAYALCGIGKWEDFAAIEKVGGFSQGVFAPLAFLWLIIATILQSRELKLQREQLALTRHEMEAATAEHRKIADVTQKAFERTRRAVREAAFEDAMVGWGLRFVDLAEVMKSCTIERRIDAGNSTSAMFNLGSPEHLRESCDRVKIAELFKALRHHTYQLTQFQEQIPYEVKHAGLSQSEFLGHLNMMIQTGMGLMSEAECFDTDKGIILLKRHQMSEIMSHLRTLISRFSERESNSIAWLN